MNLIEAIKSGKRFKRSIWGNENWVENREAKDWLKNAFSDVIAEDWVIEEPTITVTKSQVEQAWIKALKRWGSKAEYSSGDMTPIIELLEELGFKE